VTDVSFDREDIQRVTVMYDPARASVEAIVEAIERRGDRVAEVIGVARP
jgi:copper chaperone CopZ